MNFEFIKAMAEFNQKMENIEKEEKQKELEQNAEEIYKVYEALVKVGFSQKMAENMILLIIEKDLNGENNE